METFVDERTSNLLKKIENANTVPLRELPCTISGGSRTGADQVFVLKVLEDGRFETKDGRVVEIDHGIMRLPVYMTDFGRYSFHLSYDRAIICPYRVTHVGYSLLEESELKRTYPKAFSYLSMHRKELEARKESQAWYGFSAPGDFHIHDAAHIFVPRIVNRGLFARLPEKGQSDLCLMAGEGFVISVLDNSLSPYYVLALLNSKALTWYLKQIGSVFYGDMITLTEQSIGQLPIRGIDPDDPNEADLYKSTSLLGEMIMAFNREWRQLESKGDSGAARKELGRISWAEKRIEDRVNALYGLTEEEIGIVEDK